MFGQVTAGMDVVDAIEATPTDGGDRPVEPIGIESVSFAELSRPAPPIRRAPSLPTVVFDTPSNEQEREQWPPSRSIRRPTAATAAGEIPVENPATGEVIPTCPTWPPSRSPSWRRAARAAQPAWEALGFDGRARVMRRAQKWLIDNSERVIETIVSETGKSWEDAQVAEISYGAAAFGFWAKNAADYLADEKVHTANLLVKGRKLIVRYAPLGLVGVIGPWNYPLTNSFGDCIPALMAGNAVILKPSRGDAADLAAAGRGPARVRAARGRLRRRHRPRRHRPRARRRRST